MEAHILEWFIWKCHCSNIFQGFSSLSLSLVRIIVMLNVPIFLILEDMEFCDLWDDIDDCASPFIYPCMAIPHFSWSPPPDRAHMQNMPPYSCIIDTPPAFECSQPLFSGEFIWFSFWEAPSASQALHLVYNSLPHMPFFFFWKLPRIMPCRPHAEQNACMFLSRYWGHECRSLELFCIGVSLVFFQLQVSPSH